MTDIKKSGFPKDEDKKAQQQAQALHDQFIKKVDTIPKEKEKQLSK